MAVSTVHESHERIRECLSAVDFPAAKESLVEAATGNDCPDIARALRAIPAQIYANRAEVMASVMLSARTGGPARARFTY